MTGRRAIATAVAALVLVGCSVFGVRTFGFAFPADGGIGDLPVLLSDSSGAVVGIDAAAPGFVPIIDRGMANDVGNPNALVVHWIGGGCDTSVDIKAQSVSSSLDFTVTLATKPGACDAIAIPRAVRILLNRPLDMSRTSVRFVP